VSGLGRLEQIKDLRSVWKDEARDFTPWLSQESNLELIGETLGYGADWLELVEMEAVVGTFNADLLCKDTASDDRFVIIENQFGNTDHDHLGKLLTYAAGRKAKTVIWVAERVRDEHRAAIDMLNDATGDDFQFFALEIELWRIGDSQVAPRFNVIAKPNDWARRAASSRGNPTAALTDLKKTYVAYWTEFKSALSEQSTLRCQKPSPQQWMLIPIGRSFFTLTVNINTREQWIRVQLELHGKDAAGFFQLLERDKVEITAQSPIPLDWEDLPGKKGARISIKQTDTDPTDRATWNRQHGWLINNLNTLYGLFHDRVKALDLDDLEDLQ